MIASFLNALFESIYATSMMVRVHNELSLASFTEMNLSLPCSKTNLLKPGCGEGRIQCLLQAQKQRVWVAYAQSLNSLKVQKVSKGNIWGEGCMVAHDFLLTD